MVYLLLMRARHLFARSLVRSFVRSYVLEFVEEKRRGEGEREIGANCSDDLDGPVQPFWLLLSFDILGCIFDFTSYNISLTTTALAIPPFLRLTYIPTYHCLLAN